MNKEKENEKYRKNRACSIATKRKERCEQRRNN